MKTLANTLGLTSGDAHAVVAEAKRYLERVTKSLDEGRFVEAEAYVERLRNVLADQDVFAILADAETSP